MPVTGQIGGLACLLGGLLFAARLPALREKVRPIYARLGILLGILPEVASGIQSASEPTVPPKEP